MDSKVIKEKQALVKKYLSLDNVSFLLGAGTSFHLGAPIIRNVPEDLKASLQDEIETYFASATKPSFEDLFNCLQADLYLKQTKGEDCSEIEESVKKMQRWLFEKCNTEKTTIHESYSDDERLKGNRYFYHEQFVKKLLQRPNNLKRANLFTTNYDMAFDYALDNLGVNYINGFMGVHHRYFKPEVYDYDFYYPGQSVTGNVHRAEKVLRYYKIHGSLSWISTDASINNPYGIQEIPLGDNIDSAGNMMIYPCVSKKTFTLDLPYSELFRHFTSQIVQPQSVLFCLGYSFNDEHINDIIFQALSIPSFTLIVANYSQSVSDDSTIGRLKALSRHDKRIIVFEETDWELSSFVGFVNNVMPDLYDVDETESISNTLKKIFASQQQ